MIGNLIIQPGDSVGISLRISVPFPVKVGSIFGAAGGDLAGAYPNPTVAALTVSGPVQLTLQAVADGELLRRNGADIEGVAMASGAPPDVAAAGAVGVSIEPARADHTHGHGNLLGGALHADAVASVSSGFISGADQAKLDGMAPGATATPLASSAPADVDKSVAVVGVSASAARADHKHDITTAVPVSVGSVNTEGTAVGLARADHVHAHGVLAGGTLHAVATTSLAGFMSGADKTKLDAVDVSAEPNQDIVAGTALAGGGDTDTVTLNVDLGTLGTQAAAGNDARFPAGNEKAALAGTDGIPGAGNRYVSDSDPRLVGPFGDVDGPPSATDNSIARYDGGSGTIIQNSLVLIDDAGSITLPGTVDGRDVAADGAALDAHLVDVGNPHVVTAAQAGAVPTTEKGAALGVATLDVGGKIPQAQLPAIAISNTFVVASQVAMLALAAETGDVAIRTDLPDTYILQGTDPTLIGSWQILRHPTDAVTSVNGSNGVVILGAGDVGAIPSAEKGAANGVATLDGAGLLTAAQFTAAVHGNIAGGSLHSIATGAVAGFLSAADKTKLDGVAPGATASPLTAAPPANVTKAAAAVGVSTDAARADHKHDIATAVVTSVGAANVEGTSTSLARADHVHAHGGQTDPTMHAVVSGAANGFMASGDKTKLDGVAPGATSTPLTAAAPANVSKAAATVGVSTDAARADHKHDIDTAAAGAIAIGDAAAEGAASTLARSNHTHSLAAPAAPADVTKAAAAAGVSTAPARADHKHDVSTAAPVAVGTANAEGAATSLSRSDHVHNHGAQTVGTHHAAAVAGGASGFMTGADKQALDDVLAPTQVSAGGITLTTSLTDVLMPGLAQTPGAGDYLVSFSTTVSNSSNNQDVVCSIYVNGVQVANSEREQTAASAGEGSCVAIPSFLITGVGAGQVVDIRWRTTGNTAAARQRHLSLVKVG